MINQLVVYGAGKPQYPALVNFQRAHVKYKEPRMLSLYDPQTNLLFSQSEDKTREIKLQRERELIIKILSLTREELIVNSSINCIYAYLDMEQEIRAENILINKSYVENKAKLNELKWMKFQIEKETHDIVEIQRERLTERRQILADIEEWTKIYDTDVDEIDGKTLRLEALMDDARQRLQQMDEITQEKERQIEELKIEKVERDKIIAEERRKYESIVKIQSWWRGVMVRWELGEYENLKQKYKKVKIPKEKKKKKEKEPSNIENFDD